jgi:ectoine hydroxylase-related dioxygenase (phytanoyl-CoA dioxygenase family)
LGEKCPFLAQAPGYLQWNIALYDDDVLWVIPGSHTRPNTAAENSQLMADNTAPMVGGLQVKLKAGQGVVYTNTIFHWGSNYSPRLRRCVHLGFRAFGGKVTLSHLSLFAAWVQLTLGY